MAQPVKQPISGARLADVIAPLVRSDKIINAFRAVSRDYFLPDSLMPSAGVDAAFPIGYSQTTSSPSVIARMLDMLWARTGAPMKVLEVGSGCGYQTALLAHLRCAVIGVERIAALAEAAQKRLDALGYDNVEIHHADGMLGWKQQAPYAGILVCAECDEIPPALVEQLDENGCIVLPLRTGSKVQLCAVNAAGRVTARRELVQFVPLVAGLA